MPGMLTATVDYRDILAATEIVPDECHNDAPWEDSDGWEHDATTVRNLEYAGADYPAMRGYPSTGGQVVITVSPEQVKKWGVADYARASGASKQVAAELAAFNLRQTIDQLAEWYAHGWQWWGVRCDYMGERASVWGIDSEEYAEQYVRDEIAGEVAYGLEQQGYVVTHYLDRKRPTRADKLARLRRNLNSQNWGE